MIEKTGSFAQTNLPQPISGNTFNADNEMTAFNGTALTYDTNGNLLNDGTNSYAWDTRNHLTGLSGGNTASFVYDPFGRRMNKTIGGTATSFLYDGLNPVQELQSGAPNANMLTGLGIDEYFQRTDASGSSSYLTDALGSTLALANSAGGLAPSYTYDPFGKTMVAGSSTNPFQFTGRENDLDGLYYMRARYYNPTLQRFLGQDPIGIRGGMNLYGYVGNNPVNSFDLLGLDGTPSPTPTPTPTPPPMPPRWVRCLQTASCECLAAAGCTVACLPTDEFPPAGVTCDFSCAILTFGKCEKTYPCGSESQ